MNSIIAPQLRSGSSSGKKSLQLEAWPTFDPKLVVDQNVEIIVQVNGKVRDKIEAKFGIIQKEAEKLVLKSEKIKVIIGKSEVKKTIFVPNKLVNIVI